MAVESASSISRPSLRRRLPAVLGVLVLSPIAAEYLIGYQESIGRPLEMLAGLLFLAPLYGAPAVLIREAARRAGRGWPAILLLGAAFGVVQAGLIDQSLFNPDYTSGDDDVPYWDAARTPTLIPVLGISADQTVAFVAGHMIWSFAAPIAVVEACAPRIAARPWLGKAGIAVLVLLYGAAAALVANDHISNQGFTASPAQLGGAAVVVIALAAAAFLLPRRAAAEFPGLPGWLPHGLTDRPPRPWLAGLAALAVLTAFQLTPETWAGFVTDLLALAALGALLLYGSTRAGWGGTHVLSAAGAALLANAALSFVVQPLGDPDMTLKYVSNTAFTLGVLALIAWAFLRVRRAEATPALTSPLPGQPREKESQ